MTRNRTHSEAVSEYKKIFESMYKFRAPWTNLSSLSVGEVEKMISKLNWLRKQLGL